MTAITPTGKPETNLYITGLPLDSNDDFIYKLFQPFGPVKSVRLFDGNNERGSKYRGTHELEYGFCRMESHSDAIKAIQGLHKVPFPQSPVGTLFVSFKRTSERDISAVTRRKDEAGTPGAPAAGTPVTASAPGGAAPAANFGAPM